MNLQPMIDRLKAQCPAFKIVGGMAEFDASLSAPATTPACYVIPQSDTADESQGLSFGLQTVRVDFAILIAVRNAKSTGGKESLTDLDALRVAIRAALLHWLPTGATQPIAYTSGNLLDFQPGLMWWQDGYQTAHHIRST